MAMNKVIYYLIPLIFLVFAGMMIFGPDKLFSGVKDAVNTVGEYAPDVNVGMDKLNAEKPIVQEDVLSGFKQIIKDIERMRDSPNKDCFVRSTLGPIGKNAKITFNEFQGDTEVFIMGGAGGKLEVEKIVIKDVTPCVIGWKYKDDEYSVARNFFEKILNQNEIDSDEDYFMKLNTLTLYQKEESTHNRITYGPYDTKVSNSEWIYSPDGKHFCFFPTDDSNGGCEVDYGDKEGRAYLDDHCLDYVTDEETNSLFRQLHIGSLNYCNNVSRWTRVNWLEISGDVDQSEDKDKIIRGACLSDVGNAKACPTLDDNCNHLRVEPKEKEGCSIIASEYDDTGNDCADGLAPIGKIISSSMPVSLLDTTDKKESEYDDHDAVRLFKEHDWSGGKNAYICHESGYWYECNLAQKDSVLTIYGESYMCDGEVYYEWTHVSGSGDNVVLVREITKCEDYESDEDCKSDFRNVADQEIELCSWDGSSCMTTSKNYDLSEPVIVEGTAEDSNPFIECGFNTDQSCEAGEECVNGVCMKSCSGGCEEGSKCIEGTCKKSCETESDCGDDYYTCVQSLLYHDLKSCSIILENDYCPDNLVAYSGACVRPLCTKFLFNEVDTDYEYTIEFSSEGLNYLSEKTTDEVVLSGYFDYNEEFLTGVHQYIQNFYDKIPDFDAKEESQKCFPIKVGESKEVVIKAWQYDEEAFETKLLFSGKDHDSVSISCNIENEKMECKQS